MSKVSLEQNLVHNFYLKSPSVMHRLVESKINTKQLQLQNLSRAVDSTV